MRAGRNDLGVLREYDTVIGWKLALPVIDGLVNAVERVVRANESPNTKKKVPVPSSFGRIAITVEPRSLRRLLNLPHLVRGSEKDLDELGSIVARRSNRAHPNGNRALNAKVRHLTRERLVVHKGACKGHGRVQLAYGVFEVHRILFNGVLEQSFEIRWWGPCRRHRDLAVLAADRKPVALLRYREFILPEPGKAVRTSLVHAAEVDGLAEGLIGRVGNIEAGCLGARS
jgi:hypothetical protein